MAADSANRIITLAGAGTSLANIITMNIRDHLCSSTFRQYQRRNNPQYGWAALRPKDNRQTCKRWP
eukprot:scaffold14911_cov19-Prasinocladus_malaysianus.AAC.1